MVSFFCDSYSETSQIVDKKCEKTNQSWPNLWIMFYHYVKKRVLLRHLKLFMHRLQSIYSSKNGIVCSSSNPTYYFEKVIILFERRYVHWWNLCDNQKSCRHLEAKLRINYRYCGFFSFTEKFRAFSNKSKSFSDFWMDFLTWRWLKRSLNRWKCDERTTGRKFWKWWVNFSCSWITSVWNDQEPET